MNGVFVNACVVVYLPSDTVLFKARPRARIRISMFSLMSRCIEIKMVLGHIKRD